MCIVYRARETRQNIHSDKYMYELYSAIFQLLNVRMNLDSL